PIAKLYLKEENHLITPVPKLNPNDSSNKKSYLKEEKHLITL
ncbi:31568_t:CDS:1, partial [Gigaspora margarita]